MSEREIKPPKNWLDSLGYAIDGIIHAFRTEKHVRYHYVIATLALVVSLILKLPTIEFALLAISVVLLLFAEMVNTALEEVVDLVEDKYNIKAKNAKDISAGAVMVSSVAVVIMAYMIFMKYILGPMDLGLKRAGDFTGHLAFISIVLVIICVIVSKAYIGRGKPLRGGLPSGHSAIAFSLWASVGFISLNATVVILTLVMALLVSFSRLTGKIHTPFEVIMGALLGTGLTSLIFYIFNPAVIKSAL